MSGCFNFFLILAFSILIIAIYLNFTLFVFISNLGKRHFRLHEETSQEKEQDQISPTTDSKNRRQCADE
jgi:hypothetical protein